MRAPARRPCGSCPYRRDVPSGVWAAVEYEKLPEYDRPTGEQPTGVFHCHQQNDRICAGWAAVHDMDECLAMRLAASWESISVAELAKVLAYATDVPLFATGAEAAEHGLRDLQTPGDAAQRTIQGLVRKASRR